MVCLKETWRKSSKFGSSLSFEKETSILSFGTSSDFSFESASHSFGTTSESLKVERTLVDSNTGKIALVPKELFEVKT